jgi:hypothetical protein
MDWNVGNGWTTVVALADGNASIYLSSGGGSVGGGPSHESISAAARRTIAIAAEFQPQMQIAKTFPLPQNEEVTFYLLTDSGVFTSSAPVAELSTNHHSLSKLGDSVQDIITQYRLSESVD